MALPGSKNSNNPAFAGSRGSAPNPANSPAPAPMPGGMAGGGGDSFFGDIDYANTETYTPMAEGWYEAYIESLAPGVSSGGYPQLEVTFKIASGQPGEGRRQKYWLVKTANTAWKVKQFLECAGVADEEMKSVSNADLTGRFMLIQMGTDDYNDRVKILDFAPSVEFEGQVFKPGNAKVPGVPGN